MVLTPGFLNTLRQILRAAPQTAIPVGLNRIPDPAAWPPRDYILGELIGADGDLQEQITELAAAIGPALNPARRIYLTKNADDPFGGNLANAIAAAVALTPTAADPVVIEILSPGTYTGNFTLVPGLFLVALSVGPGQGTVLASDSGVTLTIPQGNSGIQGVDVLSTSADVADAAVEISVAGDPDVASFLILTDITASGGASAFRSVAGVGAFIPLITAGLNGASTGPLVDLQGGGVVTAFGFMTNDTPGTVVSITNGSTFISINTLVSNVPGGAGWLFDVDGSAMALLGTTRFFSASNLVRGSNGAFLLLFDLLGFSDATGSVLDLDVASFAQIGNNFIGSPGASSAYAGWVGTTPANTGFNPTLGWATGTTVAPDQRPPAPQPGMRFFATDRAAGAEQLTFVPGTGWVDQLGAVVP